MAIAFHMGLGRALFQRYKAAKRRGSMMGKVMNAMVLTATLLPAQAIAQATGILPGMWQTTVTVNSVEMPGAPPGIAKAMVGKSTSANHCVTPAEAARGPQEMVRQNKSCAFTHYSMVGGRLNSTMTCRQGHGSMTATTTGLFTANGARTSSRIVSTGNGMPMTMTSTTVGRRLGACK